MTPRPAPCVAAAAPLLVVAEAADPVAVAVPSADAMRPEAEATSEEEGLAATSVQISGARAVASVEIWVSEIVTWWNMGKGWESVLFRSSELHDERNKQGPMAPMNVLLAVPQRQLKSVVAQPAVLAELEKQLRAHVGS
jgi:hypothetical protein